MCDARLWRLGTAGQTKVVIIVKFTEEANSPNPPSGSDTDTDSDADTIDEEVSGLPTDEALRQHLYPPPPLSSTSICTAHSRNTTWHPHRHHPCLPSHRHRHRHNPCRLHHHCSARPRARRRGAAEDVCADSRRLGRGHPGPGWRPAPQIRHGYGGFLPRYCASGARNGTEAKPRYAKAIMTKRGGGDVCRRDEGEEEAR